MGTNHSGTITGKLNGEMTPTTPSGCLREYTSTRGGVLAERALDEVREAGRELDDLLAAQDLAHRVGDDLAVLAGDEAGQLGLAGVQQLTEREQHRLPLRDGVLRPLAEAALGGGDGLVDLAWSARATSAWTAPVAGLYTGAVRPEVEGRSAPSIQCETTAMSTSDSLTMLFSSVRRRRAQERQYVGRCRGVVCREGRWDAVRIDRTAGGGVTAGRSGL